MSRFKFVIQPADGGGDKKGKQGGWLADRKKRYGLSIREKYMYGYTGAFQTWFLHACFIVLVFLGITAVLNPESQQIIKAALSFLP